MNPETILQNEIRSNRKINEMGIVFRTNAGLFWQGKKVWSKEFNQYVLTDLRPTKALPEGFSDLLFVGKNKVAFIEVKTETGKPTKEQIRFLERMQALGHKAGIARSVEDALRLIGGGTA